MSTKRYAMFCFRKEEEQEIIITIIIINERGVAFVRAAEAAFPFMAPAHNLRAAPAPAPARMQALCVRNQRKYMLLQCCYCFNICAYRCIFLLFLFYELKKEEVKTQFKILKNNFQPKN